MAITLRAVGTAAKVADGNVIPGEPAGTTAGDIIIVAMGQNGGTSISMGGDWTPILGATTSPYAWWCRRGASAPDYTILRTGGNSAIAVAVSYYNCIASGSPIDSTNSKLSPTNYQFEAPSIDTSVAGDMIVFIGSCQGKGACGAFDGTNPVPTEIFDDTTASKGYSATLCIDHGIKSDIGATSLRTATSPGLASNYARTIALKPPPAYDYTLKRYDGAGWVKAKLMHYNGATWEAAVLKCWDGSAWKTVDVTGV